MIDLRNRRSDPCVYVKLFSVQASNLCNINSATQVWEVPAFALRWKPSISRGLSLKTLSD